MYFVRDRVSFHQEENLQQEYITALRACTHDDSERKALNEVKDKTVDLEDRSRRKEKKIPQGALVLPT